MPSEEAIDRLLAEPSQDRLELARKAWLAARIPYGRSEVFRFYGGPIDDADGPEGLLNAWPLDERYVDGVEGDPTAGIVHDRAHYPELTEELLVSLNEREGEENISTGFHAIEFLLWGQDLDDDGPGARPFTDYSTASDADRRGRYLQLISRRLVHDLQGLVEAWAPGQEENYRARFLEMPADEAVAAILNGMAMLSGFELASERLDVPYRTRLQEDEHSCFSDNTHEDALRNAEGVANVLHGNYDSLTGPGIGELLRAIDPDRGERAADLIARSVTLARALNPPFDQLILDGNPEGRAQIKGLIDNLRAQAEILAEIAASAGIRINVEE